MAEHETDPTWQNMKRIYQKEMRAENKRRVYRYDLDIDNPDAPVGEPGARLHFHAEDGLGDVVDVYTNQYGEGRFCRTNDGWQQIQGTTQYRIPLEPEKAKAQLRKELSQEQYQRHLYEPDLFDDPAPQLKKQSLKHEHSHHQTR